MIAYFYYRFTRFLCVVLPLRAAYGLATFLSILKYGLSPRDRRAVRANLRKILPVSEHKNIDKYARAVFINFGKYLVEFFKLSQLKKDFLNRTVKVKGLEYIDAALKEKKGAIILAAHMGSWELGGVFMAVQGYPIIAVALPHRHARVNKLFNKQRERMGESVIPSLGVAVRRIYAALRTNHLVALVGDRDFANAGKRMAFLGESKVMPRGPAVLSMRTGAPIIPGFIIRQEDDTHILEFSKPLPWFSTEEETIAAYTKIIEAKIRQYPAQWLMFREFWKE